MRIMKRLLSQIQSSDRLVHLDVLMNGFSMVKTSAYFPEHKH